MMSFGTRAIFILVFHFFLQKRIL